MLAIVQDAPRLPPDMDGRMECHRRGFMVVTLLHARLTWATGLSALAQLRFDTSLGSD